LRVTYKPFYLLCTVNQFNHITEKNDVTQGLSAAAEQEVNIVLKNQVGERNFIRKYNYTTCLVILNNIIDPRMYYLDLNELTTSAKACTNQLLRGIYIMVVYLYHKPLD
jgi:hypothetical protein